MSLSAVVKRRSSSRQRLLLPPNKCRPHSWHPALQRGFPRTAGSRSSGRGKNWAPSWIDSSILDGTCVTKMCERVSSTLCRAILEEVVLLGTRAVIIPVLDPNPDSELRHFLAFFNSNSNSESSCCIVLDPNPDSELRHFLIFYSPNSNSESGKKRNYNSSSLDH